MKITSKSTLFWGAFIVVFCSSANASLITESVLTALNQESHSTEQVGDTGPPQGTPQVGEVYTQVISYDPIVNTGDTFTDFTYDPSLSYLALVAHDQYFEPFPYYSEQQIEWEGYPQFFSDPYWKLIVRSFVQSNVDLNHESWTYSITDIVAPVPIPASVWLFGSALAGLVGFIHRKQTLPI